MSKFNRAMLIVFFAYIAVMAVLGVGLQLFYRPEPANLTLCPFCDR